jgi:hypothetical protein
MYPRKTVGADPERVPDFREIVEREWVVRIFNSSVYTMPEFCGQVFFDDRINKEICMTFPE